MDTSPKKKNDFPNGQMMEPRIADVLSQASGRVIEELVNELKSSNGRGKHLDDIFTWILNHGEARHVDFLLNSGLNFDIVSESDFVLRHLVTLEPSERCREIYRRLFVELKQTQPKKCKCIVSAMFTLPGDSDEFAYDWIQFLVTEYCQANYSISDLYTLALTGDYRVTRLLDKLFAERLNNFDNRRHYHCHSIVCTLGAICVFQNNIPAYLRLRPRFNDMFLSINVAGDFNEIEYSLEFRKPHNINKLCIYKAVKHFRATIWYSSGYSNTRYSTYYLKVLDRAVDTAIMLLKSARDRLKIVIHLAELEQRISGASNQNTLRLARTILHRGTLTGCLDNLTCKDYGKALSRLSWSVNHSDAWLHDMLFDKLVEFVEGPIVDISGRNDLLYGLLWFFDSYEHSKESSRAEHVLRILLEDGMYVDTFDDGPLPSLFRFTVTYPASWFFKRAHVSAILDSQCWCLHRVGHWEVPKLRCLAAARMTSDLPKALDDVHMLIGNGRVHTSMSRFIKAHATLRSDRRLFRREYTAIVHYVESIANSHAKIDYGPFRVS